MIKAGRHRRVNITELARFRLSSTYAGTLEQFSLSEEKYYNEIKRGLIPAFHQLGKEAETAASRNNPPRWAEKVKDPLDILVQALLFIEPEYIAYALQEKKNGERRAMPRGYLQNPRNIEALVVQTLEAGLNIPQTSSRDSIIEVLRSGFFNPEAGPPGDALDGLRLSNLPERLSGSPFEVLKVYDAYLQEKKQLASLFDLEQKRHIHPWDATPQGYMKKYENIELRIAHTLEENVPGLKDAKRDDAVRIIDRVIFHASEGALQYLRNIGLASVMNARAIIKSKNSPSEIVEIYNAYLQKRRGYKSLFDLGEMAHLHQWDITRYGYWEDAGNIRPAISHILEEAIPGLRNAARDEVVGIINDVVLSKKGGASHYLRENGLGPLVKIFNSRNGGHSSTFRILAEYDALRMEKDASWISIFDSSKGVYLGAAATNLGIERTAVCQKPPVNMPVA